MACELWPLDPSCLPEGWPASPTLWDNEQRLAVEIATEILKQLTAGVYGLCALKVRPCRKPCARSPLSYAPMGVSGGAPWTPMLLDGHAVNMTCGGCAGGECGCSRLCEIVMDPAVHDILEVRVDGVALEATAYRVDDGRRLVRVDGGCWPDCQELALADTEPGTFSVTYRTGNPVSAGGRMAVADLAVQVWKSCRGNANCVLSDRVTQVVREGISYTMDNLDVFERGRTGINRVDLWLASVNPYGVRTQMRAWSPDIVRSRTASWPSGSLPPTPPPGGQHFVYVQAVANTVWLIVHNLGMYPAGVRVEDTSGVDTVGEVSYVDINTVRIEFNSPLAGVAYLS